MDSAFRIAVAASPNADRAAWRARFTAATRVGSSIARIALAQIRVNKLKSFLTLLGVMIEGWPSLPISLALIMELVVTPGLALWQARVARRR